MVLGRCVDTSLLVKVCCIRRLIGTSAAMSHSKYEYVRRFEADDRLLPNTWIVVRLDGKAFHKSVSTIVQTCLVNVRHFSLAQKMWYFMHEKVYRHSRLQEAQRQDCLGPHELMRESGKA